MIHSIFQIYVYKNKRSGYQKYTLSQKFNDKNENVVKMYFAGLSIMSFQITLIFIFG